MKCKAGTELKPPAAWLCGQAGSTADGVASATCLGQDVCSLNGKRSQAHCIKSGPFVREKRRRHLDRGLTEAAADQCLGRWST